MNMKKKVLAFLAAMTLCTQFTGCWLFDDEDYGDTETTETTASETVEDTTVPPTESTTVEETEAPTTEPTEESTEAPTEETTIEETTEETTEAVTEAQTEETTEAETEAPTQGGPPQQDLNLDAEYDESKFLTYVDMPECKPDAGVKESDFAGYWVCDVMAKGNTAYNAICGYPVSATGHLAIDMHNAAFDENGTGKFINIKPIVVSNEPQGGPPQGGPPQAAAAAQEPSEPAVATETELPMVYTFENGTLKASVTIPVGPPKNKNTPDAMQGIGGTASPLQGPPPKQMVLQMTDDGRILIQTPNADGTMTSAYYKKVDQFEDFDWGSVQFDFESIYKTEAE